MSAADTHEPSVPAQLRRPALYVELRDPYEIADNAACYLFNSTTIGNENSHRPSIKSARVLTVEVYLQVPCTLSQVIHSTHPRLLAYCPSEKKLGTKRVDIRKQVYSKGIPTRRWLQRKTFQQKNTTKEASSCTLFFALFFVKTNTIDWTYKNDRLTHLAADIATPPPSNTLFKTRHTRQMCGTIHRSRGGNIVKLKSHKWCEGKGGKLTRLGE